MKLKSDFISYDAAGARYLVPAGGEAFSGIARGNKAAAAIIDLLKEDTTEAEIIDAMCARYPDAPRDLIASDVTRVLNTLHEINAIE